MVDLPAWPLVKLHDENHPIRTLQYLLREHGFLDVQVDGKFGNMTEWAVRLHQKTHKLEQDGQVGPLTWTVLLVSVNEGCSGEAVAGVQDEIEYRNMASPEEHLGLPIDGIFGEKTRNWVCGFQEACGLETDGIVGWKTWRCLVTGMYAG